MQYLSFCAWLILLSIMFSNSIHVVVNDKTSFFLKAERYSTAYIHHIFYYPFICQWTFSIVSTFWLLWIVLRWTWEYRHLFTKLISNHLNEYLKVSAESHGNSILIFLRNIHTVLHKAVLIYISINSVTGFPFSTSSPTLMFHLFDNCHSDICEMISHCGFN